MTSPPKTPLSVHQAANVVAAQKKLHKPDSGPALAHVWQLGMKEHAPGVLITVGAADMAMLKGFAKHFEPGTAEAGLAFLLAHWIGFVQHCEQEGGAYKTPATPALWFLRKYAVHAATFYLQKTTKASTSPLTPPPEPPPLQVIAEPKPAEPPATLADLLAPVDVEKAKKDG